MRLAYLAFLIPLAGCAVKGATGEEKTIRMFLAPGSMGLSLIIPSEGSRGLAYYTYSRMLRNAARRGDDAEVERLLTRGGDPNHKDSDGWSALMLAVNEGHARTAAFLVEKKDYSHGQWVATNRITPLTKNEALAVAVQRKHGEIAAMLLRNGASANAANDQGQSLLMRAAHVGSPEMVRMLLAAGADRNAKDSDNLTALDWARKAGCAGCQELLQ